MTDESGAARPSGAGRRKELGAAVVGAAMLVLGLAGVWAWLGWGVGGPLASGESAYARGDYAVAAEAARDRLREHPEDPEALRLLARSLARLGRDEASRRIYDRLDEDDLAAEDLALTAARDFLQGRLKADDARVERALALDPDNTEALAVRAGLLAATGRPAEAVAPAKRLADLIGQEARGAALLGMIHEALGDRKAAAESFARALRADPSLTDAQPGPIEARRRLARDRLALGEPSAALATLAELPDDAEVQWLRSRALLQAGRTAEAVEALAKAGGARPGDPIDPEPAPFVGSARCVECHKAIHDAQRSSHHATTFHRAGEVGELPLPDAPVPDPYDPSVSHAIRPAGDGSGRYALETSRDGESVRALILYVMGSGDRGATPVGLDESGRFRELRLSHYGDGSGWDRTTGQPEAPEGEGLAAFLGKVQTEDEVRRCLGCHTTDAHSARTDQGPAARDRAIGCETCHGPGGHHVLAMRAAPAYPDLAIAQPRLADGEAVTSLCARCHGQKEAAITPEHPVAIRFQGTTLTWSPCYSESRGALSCVTCHDPHHDAEPSAGFYESKCLACHTPGGPTSPPHAEDDGTHPLGLADDMTRTPCPVSPSGGCVSCHMPAQSTIIPHTTFTDHFIRVHREEGPPE